MDRRQILPQQILLIIYSEKLTETVNNFQARPHFFVFMGNYDNASLQALPFFKISCVIFFPRRNIRTTNQSFLQQMHQQCNIHFQVKRVLSRQLLPGLTKTNWYLSYNFLTLACIRFTSKPNSQQNESKSAEIYRK